MPTDINLYATLAVLFFSFLFGFGFTAGAWLWNALLAGFRRGEQ